MVADALSQKSTATLSHIKAVYLPLMLELRTHNAKLIVKDSGALLASFQVRPTLIDEIYKAQAQDPPLKKIIDTVYNGLRTNFTIRKDGTLMCKNRVCVLKIGDLKRQIMKEAHCSLMPCT